MEISARVVSCAAGATIFKTCPVVNAVGFPVKVKNAPAFDPLLNRTIPILAPFCCTSKSFVAEVGDVPQFAWEPTAFRGILNALGAMNKNTTSDASGFPTTPAAMS